MLGILYVILVLICISIPLISVLDEMKNYNCGVCRDCGCELKLFDYDYQGNRGYRCDKCGYQAWVSYSFVDGF